MPEVWYWLTCSFSLDPQVYSVNVSLLWSRSATDIQWQLKEVTRSQSWKDWLQGCRRRGYEMAMLVQACPRRARPNSSFGQSDMQGEACAQPIAFHVEVSQHNEDNIGIDMQSLHIEQAEQTVVAMPSTVQQDGSSEADEGEEINGIVDEIERVDRNAREDEANLAQEEDEEADDEEYEVQPVIASWNREDLGYIGKNELHDSVWFYGDGPINKGTMFSTKSAFQDAVKSWSFKMQRQFKVLKSSLTVYTAVCETEGCNFRVHGHVPKYESYWLVSRVEEHNNCMLRNTRSSHRNLTAAYVANKYYSNIIEADDLLVRHIIKAVETSERYTISYHKAWRAKQKAMEKRYGSFEVAYDTLPQILDILKQRNPGTYVVVQDRNPGTYVVVQDRDSVAFYSFGACIHAFQWSRPVLYVDGTFLTGKYSWSILTVVGADANNQIIPFHSKRLMQMFKRLCMQNQQQKLEDLWRQLDDATATHVKSKKDCKKDDQPALEALEPMDTSAFLFCLQKLIIKC
ncbi:hypothetical protein DAI22_03g224050 [Oryza sativa Japonica Group]|nr:hypothetical protein DAI22_03g224050 [Oryza sativa Japonica Group]